MALARDQMTSCSFYGNFLEPASSSQFKHIICPNYGFDDNNQNQDMDRLDNGPKKMTTTDNQAIMSHSSLSTSSSGNSSNSGFLVVSENNRQPCNMGQAEAHPLISFKSGYLSTYGSNFLCFHQGQDQDQTNCNITNYQKLLSPPSASFSHLLDEVNCSQPLIDGCHDPWLFAEETVVDHPPGLQVSGGQQTLFSKRPHSEEETIEALKKQCRTGSSKKASKPKSSSSTSKDPQSIAAKNRRERISERLKVLQDLVPNGSKVDLVTMLEKAIGYVKFLQLQVMVLATDEFWPAADSKAPDISQVREAIDAILSSQGSENGRSST